MEFGLVNKTVNDLTSATTTCCDGILGIHAPQVHNVWDFKKNWGFDLGVRCKCLQRSDLRRF